ncbi:hypothetical protein PG999_004321 [Apiospora kogelbergensis]|uniref:Uncharacterized protein n=1 Tax=Apiospora kogelbergensis TaxID=1337665 RepID=A0AAW0QZ15_9PEZI
MSSWDQIHSCLIFQSGIGFVYRQLFMRPPPIAAGVELDGQTAIITGANTGLGFEAARQLLQLNLSRLILAVRSQAKGDVAAEALRREFLEARIEVWILDLEDPGSVSAFAIECQTLGRIDMVILNAGVQNKDCVVSPKTGKEQTFQVNYLSTIMLAFDEKYDATKWYAREKLLQMIFVRRLAALVSSDQVIINTVCPGLVGETDIWRSLNTSAILRYMLSVYFALFGRGLTEGASTYVHAAVIAGQESHGGFLSEWGVRPYPATMYSKRGESLERKVVSETRERLKSVNIPDAPMQDF